MTFALAAIFALGVLLAPLSAFSEDFVMKPPEARIGIKINGPFSQDANPVEWPSTFVYRGVPAGGPCTATAIGAQVILTAAHCLDTSAAGTIEIAGKERKVTCQKHPAWSLTNPTADYSLCLVTPALPAPPGGFESVNTDASSTAAGTKIKLLGFGCRGKSGASFGTLGEGDATILLEKDGYVLAGGGVDLCFGDSGGGVYAPAQNYMKSRRLVAVNSRTDDHAWLSITSGALFLDWAKNWATNQKVAICGLTPAARGCHQ